MSYSEIRIIIIINYDDDEEFLRTIGQFWTASFSLRTKVSQTLQSVLCITTNKYLVRVLVVLLHACFSVRCQSYTFSIGRHFFFGSSLPDTCAP